MIYARATRLIWEGAGRPQPMDYDSLPVPPRAVEAAACAMCGEPGPGWLYNDLFSENFHTLANTARLFPHRTVGLPLAFCAACTWSARSLALRCASFFARESGVWFVARRQLLAALLDPPEPPFVAAAPLYGCDHGGEMHGWRCPWPGAPPLPSGYYWPLPEGEPGAKVVAPLSRLQAKHVAVYATVATSRDRYPLQWDDTTPVMVDRPLWTALAAQLAEVAGLLRAGSVTVTDTRDALRLLRCPARAPVAVHARWSALTRGLSRHARAVWWPLLADLLPLPDAPPREERPAKPARPAKIAPAPTPAKPSTPQLTLF